MTLVVVGCHEVRSHLLFILTLVKGIELLLLVAGWLNVVGLVRAVEGCQAKVKGTVEAWLRNSSSVWVRFHVLLRFLKSGRSFTKCHFLSEVILLILLSWVPIISMYVTLSQSPLIKIISCSHWFSSKILKLINYNLIFKLFIFSSDFIQLMLELIDIILLFRNDHIIVALWGKVANLIWCVRAIWPLSLIGNVYIFASKCWLSMLETENLGVS